MAPRTPPAGFPDAVPVLTDGTVTLRAHRAADVGGVVEQCTDPATARFVPLPAPYTGEDAEAFLGTIRSAWERSGATDVRYWAIEALDDEGAPRFAGSIDYRPDGSGAAAIGYGLHPWARGRGLTSRAVRLAAAHTLSSDGVQTLHWRAAVGNWPSRRVAWRCGFRIEGTVRDLMAHPDGRQDGWVGSLRQGDRMAPAHRWLEPPVLTGDRVRLRPWRESDRPTEEFDEAARDFVGPILPGAGEAGFAAFLTSRRTSQAEGSSVGWCVADRVTDEPLGMMSIFALGLPFVLGSAEVGYWLHPHARGRGVLGEALDLAVGHAFAPAPDDPEDATGGLGLHRLYAHTDIRNTASQHVLARRGFRLAGVERQALGYTSGGPRHDGPIFELLPQWYADRSAYPAPAARHQAVLNGERIRLRPFGEADLPRMAELLRHDDIGPRANLDAGQEQARAWLNAMTEARLAGEARCWAVTRRQDDVAIGYVNAFRLSDRFYRDSAEIGYWLQPDARGRGLSHEALEALVPHLLADVADGGLGLRGLRAVTSPENLAYRTVLERSGFTRWAREPEAVAPGSSGQQRTATQGTAPSPDRLHYHVTSDTDRVAAAALHEAARTDPVTLEGAGVRLRAWRESDADRVAQACADPTSQHWLAQLPHPYTPEHALDFIRRSREQSRAGEALPWCVADLASDTCCGAVSLMGLQGEDPSSAEVGYWAHPDARAHGMVTEAVRLAVRHAVVEAGDGGLGLRRLQLNVADGNGASAVVARRAGFVETGRDRRAEPLGGGTFADLVRFDLLASDLCTPDRT